MLEVKGKTEPESSPQVHETTFSEKDDVTSRGHCEAVNLRLDVNRLLRISLEPSNIYLDVEVANANRIVKKSSRGYATSANLLANNGILGHDFEVLCRDDVPVPGGGYEYIGTRRSILHGGDLVTGHGGL
jgi:hypothetical protein